MVLDIIALVCSVVLPVTLFFLGRRLDSKDKKRIGNQNLLFTLLELYHVKSKQQ